MTKRYDHALSRLAQYQVAASLPLKLLRLMQTHYTPYNKCGWTITFLNVDTVQLVAEVELLSNSKFKVHQVYAAIDVGIVINPEGVIAQVEGGIIDGLSAASG